MREAAKLAFTARFGSPSTLPKEALHIENAVRSLVERFSEEMICVDCNAADGHAKAKLAGEINPHFSFGPSEIGGFIESAPNRAHNINVGKAREIWETQRAEFNARFDLIKVIMNRLEGGGLRRERTGSELRTAELALRTNWFISQAFHEATRNSPHQKWDSSACLDFVARSTANDGAGLRSSQKPRQASAAPSDGEFEAINRAMIESSTWRLAGADWRCTCCTRSKREICRKSNSGKWTAWINHSRDYVLERDPTSIELRRELYPAFTDDPMIGDYVYYTICQDCFAIGPQLKARRPEITQVYFSIDNLKELIGEVEANRNHQRDFAAAAARAIDNLPITEAAEAFQEHYELSGSAFAYYRLAREKMRDGEARAYAAIKLERDRGLSDLDPFIDWLLAEGARLNQRRNKPMV